MTNTNPMPPLTSQQRFHQTISGHDVRPPLFPEGLREGVLQGWRSQGFLRRKKLENIFHYDTFEELDIATDLRQTYRDWPTDRQGLRDLRRRIDPEDPRWLPKGWSQKVKRWSQRDYPLFLVVHDGLFLTMGISDGASFSQAMVTLCKDRAYVEELLALQAEFEGGLAARLLREVSFDAAIFSEPIASHQGTLISPKMYAELVLPSYDPLTADAHVKTGCRRSSCAAMPTRACYCQRCLQGIVSIAFGRARPTRWIWIISPSDASWVTTSA